MRARQLVATVTAALICSAAVLISTQTPSIAAGFCQNAPAGYVKKVDVPLRKTTGTGPVQNTAIRVQIFVAANDPVRKMAKFWNSTANAVPVIGFASGRYGVPSVSLGQTSSLPAAGGWCSDITVAAQIGASLDYNNSVGHYECAVTYPKDQPTNPDCYAS